MTDTKPTPRRPIGPRRPDHRESSADIGDDPLSELTRFMGSDADPDQRPQRDKQSDAYRPGPEEGAGDEPSGLETREEREPDLSEEVPSPGTRDDRAADQDDDDGFVFDLDEDGFSDPQDEPERPARGSRGGLPFDAFRKAFSDELEADRDGDADDPFAAADKDEAEIHDSGLEAEPDEDGLPDGFDDAGVPEGDQAGRVESDEDLSASDDGDRDDETFDRVEEGAGPTDAVNKRDQKSNEPSSADDDPFMQALMMELDGEGDRKPAASPASSRPKPSFAIPASSRRAAEQPDTASARKPDAPAPTPQPTSAPAEERPALPKEEIAREAPHVPEGDVQSSPDRATSAAPQAPSSSSAASAARPVAGPSEQAAEDQDTSDDDDFAAFRKIARSTRAEAVRGTPQARRAGEAPRATYTPARGPDQTGPAASQKAEAPAVSAGKSIDRPAGAPVQDPVKSERATPPPRIFGSGLGGEPEGPKPAPRAEAPRVPPRRPQPEPQSADADPDPDNPTIAALNRLRDRLGRRASDETEPGDTSGRGSAAQREAADEPRGTASAAAEQRSHPAPVMGRLASATTVGLTAESAASPTAAADFKREMDASGQEERPQVQSGEEEPSRSEGATAPEPSSDATDAQSPSIYRVPRRAEAGETTAETGPDQSGEAAPIVPVPTVRPRRAVPSFRFSSSEHTQPAEEVDPAPRRSGGLDFDDLPGVSSTDPWRAFAAPKPAEPQAPDMADRLADALFAEDEDDDGPVDAPRFLGVRSSVADRGDDGATPEKGGASDDPAADDEAAASGEDVYEDAEYEDYDEYDADDQYYDEAEPEWEQDEHTLPEHSLDEMDAALGLSQRKRRPIVPIAAGVAGLIALGIVGYFLFGATSVQETESGPPPVIEANADGVKVVPDQGGSETTAQTKAVYDRVGGEGESGRVVQSSEAPIDPAENSLANGASSASSPLLPKRVRTVVVRPDGTIIPAEEVDAGRSTAASDQGIFSPSSGSDAPASLTGGTATASDAADPETATDTPDSAETAAITSPSPIRTSERLPTSQPQPADDATTASQSDTRSVTTSRVTETPSGSPLALTPDGGAETPTASSNATAPLPAPAPTRSAAQSQPATSQSGGVGERVSPAQLAANSQRATRQQPASNTQAAPSASESTQVASAPSGPWAVQVSSQRSPEAARATYQQLQSRFPSVLGGRQPSIQAADLGTRGTFYRVRLPVESRAAANQLCSDLKAAGGDCFIGRN